MGWKKENSLTFTLKIAYNVLYRMKQNRFTLSITLLGRVHTTYFLLGTSHPTINEKLNVTPFVKNVSEFFQIFLEKLLGSNLGIFIRKFFKIQIFLD